MTVDRTVVSDRVTIKLITVGQTRGPKREPLRGYDVVVTNPQATVQDYLTALNLAIERLPLTRRRLLPPPGQGQIPSDQRLYCRGCDRCCRERVPLTYIDALKLIQATSSPSLGLFLRRYGYIWVQGRAVDISLAWEKQAQGASAHPDRRCVFLNPETQTCQVYTARPLVCQTFICCPQTRRARRLREVIVNRGEDELVRQWLAEAAATGREPEFHEGYNPRPREEDWPPTPFSGRTDYQEVRLKEICPPRLWEKLLGP